MVGKSPPRWNWVSVGTPIASFFVAGGVAALGEGLALWHRDIINVPAILIWAGFCVFGFIVAGVALVRKERFWGITAIGMLLNAPLPLLIFWFYTMELLNCLGWIR